MFEEPLFVFCFLLYDLLAVVRSEPRSQLFHDEIENMRLPWTQEYVELACWSLVDFVICVRGLRSFSVPPILLGISHGVSASSNNSMYNLIFHRSIACSFLLIAALLSHVLVVSLMTFAEVLVDVVVKTLRANLRRQGVTRTRNSFRNGGGISCGLQ